MTPTRPPESPLGRQILGIIFGMVLCIVVPLFLHEVTGGSSNPRSPWWSLAITVLSGVLYACVTASVRRQLFALVLWLFTYVFLGLAPYVQYRLDATLSTIPHVDEALYPAAGMLVLLSGGAAILGSVAAGRSSRPVRALAMREVSPQRANLLTAVGMVLFLYYGAKVGYGAFLGSREELSLLRQAAWSSVAVITMLTGALTMVLLVAFLAQMAVQEQRRQVGQTTQWLLPLISGALLLYAVNPISSPRYVFGTVALAVLASLGAYATMTRYRIMSAASLLGLLMIFPLADAFRHSTDTTLEIVSPVAAFTSGDFDAFSQIVNTLDYLDSHAPTYGEQLLGALLFWVPSQLWPDKPEATGSLLAEYMNYDFTNLSSPLWAELAIDFGVPGAVIGMGVLGYWFRRMDCATDLHLRIFSAPTVIASATTFYLFIVLRGSLLVAVSYLLVILLASQFVTQRPPIRSKQGPAGLNRRGFSTDSIRATPPGGA